MAHRVLPHTADAIVEATAGTPAECLAEAVTALAEVYVDTAMLPDDLERVAVHLEATEPLEQLLDEALFLLDSRGLVCVDAALSASADGFAGELIGAPADAVEVTGSVPKGIADAALRRDGDEWVGRAIVDV